MSPGSAPGPAPGPAPSLLLPPQGQLSSPLHVSSSRAGVQMTASISAQACAHTCAHSCTHEHTALHSVSVPVCANAPCGPSAVSANICQAPGTEKPPETLSQPDGRPPPLTLGMAQVHVPEHAPSASAFLTAACCPITQTHVTYLMCPTGRAWVVSAAHFALFAATWFSLVCTCVYRLAHVGMHTCHNWAQCSGLSRLTF